MWELLKSTIKISLQAIAYAPIAISLVLASLLSRYFGIRDGTVGIGPEPIIANIYHKRAMEKFGWKAETFASHTYYITSDFDYLCDRKLVPLSIRSYWLFLRSLFRYQIVYFYFNGGPLGWTWHWRMEAYLYRLAGIRTVVLAYGSDVQDFLLTPNLLFKHAMSVDYPGVQRSRRQGVRAQVDYWTRRADHIVGGCDWVDYLPHWDTLVTDHFYVDTNKIEYLPPPNAETLKILHAPNHRAIKGTQAIIDAVAQLRSEGYAVELIIAERSSNEEILTQIQRADVIVDQLIVGWYGMFAIEAMAIGRPVVTFLDPRYVDLFVMAGLIRAGEIPTIQSDIFSIQETLRELLENRKDLGERGILSRKYVETHQGLDSGGRCFDSINRSLDRRDH